MEVPEPLEIQIKSLFSNLLDLIFRFVSNIARSFIEAKSNSSERWSRTVLQDEHILLHDTGRDHVRVHRCNVVAEGIQERKIDIQSMAAVQLLLTILVSHCIRTSTDRPDRWICSPRGLWRPDMRTTSAHLLSNRDNRVPFKEDHMRSGQPSGLHTSAQLYIRVSWFLNLMYI